MDSLTLSIVSHGHGPLLSRLLHDLNVVLDLAPVEVIVTLNLAAGQSRSKSAPGDAIQWPRGHRIRESTFQEPAS